MKDKNEIDVGKFVKIINNMLDSKANRDFRKWDLTCSQHAIIAYLFDHQSVETTQRDLEQTFSLKNPTVTGLLNLLENYMTIGGKIFQANSSIFGLRQFVSDKYNSAGIQSLTQMWFGVKSVDKAKVPTLIMAYDLSDGRPQMIRSYGEEGSFPAWVAARATSAAPTYFSPCEYAGKLLVDGGVIANNPALYAYFEAKKLYPDCKYFHILSFSTGGSISRRSKKPLRD